MRSLDRRCRHSFNFRLADELPKWEVRHFYGAGVRRHVNLRPRAIGWVEGFELSPALKGRKLLIPQSPKDAGTGTSAEPGYTAGTRAHDAEDHGVT